LETEPFRLEQEILATDHANGSDGANVKHNDAAGLKRENALTALLGRPEAAFDCLILLLGEIREGQISVFPKPIAEQVERHWILVVNATRLGDGCGPRLGGIKNFL
jgi:hypothetical protein